MFFNHWEVKVTNGHIYVPLDVNTFRYFPRSWLITVFVIGVTRRMPLVEQELCFLPEHLSSLLIFSGILVTRSLVLYVMFRRSLFVLLAIVLSVLRYTDSDYPVDLRILITPLIYGFWLPRWFTDSDYPVDLRVLITPLASSNSSH